MEKIYTIKSNLDEDIAHLDKLANASGHKIPETTDMHVSGSRITQKDRDGYNWSNILGQHICQGQKHPTKAQWSLHVTKLHADNVGSVDAGHTLDLKDTVAKLPDDWAPSTAKAVMAIE